MMNYIKSELYRIVHSKGIYILSGICALLLLSMNVVLHLFGQGGHFAYNNTEFVFSMVWSALNAVFFLTLVMGSIIFADEYKNKTISNSIAFGYSRISLYFGKILVGMIVSVAALAAVMGIFIISAYLLLENSGIDVLLKMFRGIGASIPALLTGEIAAITFCFLLGTTTGAIWSWFGLMIGVPMVSEILGMMGKKFDFFARLSKWLVYEVLQDNQIIVTEDGMAREVIMAWMTRDGLIRMILAGVIGIAIFLIWGVLGLRCKEIK